jgi:hypothetical protein
MKTFNFLILIIFSLVKLGCHHNPINSKLSDNWQPMTQSQNLRLLNKQTRTHKEYVGLHMSFQSHLIFVNSDLATNQVKLKSQYKNWSEQEAIEKLNETQADLNKKAQFFLSFYSPNSKRNKLDQKASDWKVILKTNSSEIEGVVKYEDNISDHTKIFYPNIEHWGKPYKVSFPVPTSQLETSPFEVVLMGPEGMASFKY